MTALQSPGPTLALGDLFGVRRGIATGAKDFFVLTQRSAAMLGLPNQFLRPILPNPSNLPINIIPRALDGHPDLSERLVLLDCNGMPPDRLQQQFPAVWAYLEQGLARGLGKKRRGYRFWYNQERAKPAPFLATYVGFRQGGNHPVRFLWNQSDAIAAATYWLLYPRDALAATLSSNPDMGRQVLDVLLAAEPPGLSQTGRLHRIDKPDLARIPLPDLATLLV